METFSYVRLCLEADGASDFSDEQMDLKWMETSPRGRWAGFTTTMKRLILLAMAAATLAATAVAQAQTQTSPYQVCPPYQYYNPAYTRCLGEPSR
jgi:hypothetical protein